MGIADYFSLHGTVVIVTGGAGHLGSAISKGLAEAGASVFVTGRDRNKLDQLDAFNSSFESRRIFCEVLDVTVETAFRKWVDSIVTKYGAVDCLINNANSALREKWEDLDKEAFLKGFEGSINHYFTCTQIVSKYMLQKNKGSIINNASLFSFLAPQFPMHLDLNNAASVHHVAAKGGVLQMTRYLAALWGQKGLRVNAVSPGYFPQKRGPERPDYMREVQIRIPMGRVGTPAEVAGTFVFLASNASTYITGQNVIVDGGYSIW